MSGLFINGYIKWSVYQMPSSNTTQKWISDIVNYSCVNYVWLSEIKGTNYSLPKKKKKNKQGKKAGKKYIKKKERENKSGSSQAGRSQHALARMKNTESKPEWRDRKEGRINKGRERRRERRKKGLDAVKRLAVACIAVPLRSAALLAGRSRSHVCAGECLQLVQLLRQFSQHASAEVGTALG